MDITEVILIQLKASILETLTQINLNSELTMDRQLATTFLLFEEDLQRQIQKNLI